MKNKDRRDFLKKSILGISGAALFPGRVSKGVIALFGHAIVQLCPL